MFIVVLLTLLLILLVFFACAQTLSFFTGAPFVVTPRKVVEEMMTLAGIGKNDIVMDLGSGDGRILIAAAKKGAKSYGWEINPLLALWSIIATYRNGVSQNVSVACQSYQKADLKKATVVIFYNIPGHLKSLETKLQKELKPGTKIISYEFPLKNYKFTNHTQSGIYVYVVPNRSSSRT